MSEPESKLTSKTKDVIAIKIFKDSPGFTSITFGIRNDEPGIIYATAFTPNDSQEYTISYTCTPEEECTLTDYSNPDGVKDTFQHIVNVMVAQLRMEVGKDLQDAMYQKQETLNAGHYLH